MIAPNQKEDPAWEQSEDAILDLFRFTVVRRFFSSRAYPLAFQIGASLVFAAIIAYGFLGPPHGEDNFAVVVTWMLWWLLLPFSFVFLARLWCGVCPLGATSDMMQKVFAYKRRAPAALFRKAGTWIAGLSFLGLAWAGMLWQFDDKPRATAIILLSLLFATILISLIYERRTWCRYLCPLGLMAALYSMVSFVGLRSNRKLCRNACKSTRCYEVRGQIEGCPMFEVPGVMDSNRDCNLCGKCIKHCPQQSMRLLLRRPVAELWQRWQPTKGEAFFVMVLMALVFFEVVRMTPLYPDYMKQLMEANIMANYNLVLSLSLLTLVGITTVSYGLSSRLSSLAMGRAKGKTLMRYAYAYIPIVLAGYLGAAIQHLAVYGVRATKVAINQLAVSSTVFDLPAVAREATYAMDPLLKTIQLLILALGTLGALYACLKIAKQSSNPRALATAFPHLILIGVFSLSLFFLFLLPMGLLH
ncbi:MAG: 4Fe-4S binding protein [Chloroflexi bacterium]|nr:4Fe-4S binding protein [Chloroflexota bacterium]